MNDERQLIDGYLDGELTADEERRLAEWLAADREHIRQFVRETQLHRQLRDTMLARQFQTDALAAVERAERKRSPSPIQSLTDWLRQLLAYPRSPARRGAWVALAACLALVAGLGVWYFRPTVGEPVLAEVQGTGLSLERAGQTLPAAAGTRLQSGDVLRTPENVTAAISFAPENTRIMIEPGTELKVTDLSHGKRFALGVGKLEASVARQRPLRPMTLVTRQAEARVLGTKFTLATTNNVTRLDVAEGEVRLTRASDRARVDVPKDHYAIAATNIVLSSLQQTGTILREIWTGIPGGGVNDLLYHPDYPAHPAARDFVKSFETEEIGTNNFGCQLSGYIHPPVTGEYTFWIAGTAEAVVWLSADENPAGKARIAAVANVLPRQWDMPRQLGFARSQRSPPIHLVASRHYFIQAMQKTALGSSHLSVAWQPPGGEREIIAGKYLSPFKPKPKEEQ